MHFVNTIEGRLGDHPIDFLTNYPAVARWSFHVGALEETDADRLIGVAASRPAEAAEVADRAVRLRVAIDATFRHIARSHTPDDQCLEVLQQTHAEALANAHLTRCADGFAWSWDHRVDDLRRPLWLVTQLAVDLLTAGELSRIRQCPGTIGGCDWLFYDTSRNATRRWCSMEGCGSKVKARRQYERQKHAAKITPGGGHAI